MYRRFDGSAFRESPQKVRARLAAFVADVHRSGDKAEELVDNVRKRQAPAP